MAYDYGFNLALNDNRYARPSFLVTIEDCWNYALGYYDGVTMRSALAELA